MKNRKAKLLFARDNEWITLSNRLQKLGGELRYKKPSLRQKRAVICKRRAALLKALEALQ